MQKPKSATLMTRGFTLIELLVVVSIIALMAAIMMPSLKEVRRISRRTICQKNLDQIGVGMHNYLVNHKDTYPYACRVPSWERTEAARENPPRKPLPSIPEVLRSEVRGGRMVQSKSTDSHGYIKTTTMSVNEVFACPSDKNTMSRAGEVDPSEVIPTERYFDNEGTSYEWEDRLNGEVVGFKLMRVYAKYQNKRYEVAKLNKSQMWMMFDFESFHGGKAMRGSQNILYTDLHVQADNWSDGKSVGKEMALIPQP